MVVGFIGWVVGCVVVLELRHRHVHTQPRQRHRPTDNRKARRRDGRTDLQADELAGLLGHLEPLVPLLVLLPLHHDLCCWGVCWESGGLCGSVGRRIGRPTPAHTHTCICIHAHLRTTPPLGGLMLSSKSEMEYWNQRITSSRSVSPCVTMITFSSGSCPDLCVVWLLGFWFGIA